MVEVDNRSVQGDGAIPVYVIGGVLGDTTKPTITITLPATSTSFTVAVSVVASDNIGVTGYWFSETEDNPAVGDEGWVETAIEEYTFSAIGDQTLYAYAKDAAGNVSEVASDTCTVSFVDTFDTDGAMSSPWLNAAWSVSDGAAVAAVSGVDVITNGDMELDSSWGNSGTPTTNERSITQAHEGTYSRHFVTDGTNEGITQQPLTTVTGRFYRLHIWVYPVAQNTSRILVRNGAGTAWPILLGAEPINNSQWNQITRSYYESSGGNSAYVIVGCSSAGADHYVDDVELVGLTDFSNLLDCGEKNQTVKAAWNIVDNGMAGVIARSDGTLDNCLLAYHNKTNAVLIEYISGVPTVKINAAASYSAGANIEIRVADDTAQLFYNGIQVGTDQIVGDTSNTRIGIFATDAACTCAEFYAEKKT